MVKHFTPMHKLKLSRALKGRKKSEETKERISFAMTGRKLSKKTRVKMQLRENRKQAIHQRLVKHYLEKHEAKPRLDRRRIVRVCHICDQEV
jgi:hypothetical protein